MDSNNQTRVLLVEDDPGDVRRVNEQLRNGGSAHFQVVHATRFSTALEELARQGFDVLLLDLSLPDFPGTAGVEKILQKAPELPIIVLTGATEESLALEALKMGAQDHLIKGETPAGILIRAIHYAIHRKHTEFKLTQTIAALQEANRQILAQQKSVIEEERLKVLLQMAGATAHELNQPIMTLLGTIEIMRLDDPIPVGWEKHVQRIEASGRRIAEIVKKMSTIRNIDFKPYPGGTSIINLDQNIRVLAVEDSDVDFERFKEHLAHQDRIELTRAASKAEAMVLMAKKKFDLVFLDYILPDGKGLELLLWMAKEKLDVPVIAITGHGDEIVASRMIKAGALDYLPKAAISQDTLSHCIFNVLEKFQLKKEVEHATQKMVQMATRDPLTGLYNRHYMNDVLEKEFGRALRYGNDLACLLFDLDFFKEVNDTYGHRFGDFVLQKFADRVRTHIRQTDASFRYGGEEFLILLPQTDVCGAREMAEKIRALCELEKYDDGRAAATVTVSVGIASVRQRPVLSATDLLSNADKALYQAKAQGRNNIKVFQLEIAPSDRDKKFQFLRERLAAILDKAKKATLESLELMARDMGGERFKKHNQRVLQYLDLIGAKLKFDPATIKSMQRAAMLHDFTKVLLGDFFKKAQLTAAERSEIENHPYILTELIEPFDFFADERTVMLWHHENYDGSGYPDGLKGDEIPIGARIFGLIDALVAMTSERPHKKMNTPQETVRELVTHAGTQFDPMLVDIVLDVIKENNLLDVSEKAAPQERPNTCNWE